MMIGATVSHDAIINVLSLVGAREAERIENVVATAALKGIAKVSCEFGVHPFDDPEE